MADKIKLSTLRFDVEYMRQNSLPDFERLLDKLGRKGRMCGGLLREYKRAIYFLEQILKGNIENDERAPERAGGWPHEQ